VFIGFIFWYKGLAQGGITTVGQLQLLQPFFGLLLLLIFCMSCKHGNAGSDCWGYTMCSRNEKICKIINNKAL
jgi:hypothetical protein